MHHKLKRAAQTEDTMTPTAEGYQSIPLSDELERRIRMRITLERNEGERDALAGRDYMAAISEGRVSALEWVLREAEMMKDEGKVKG